MTIIIRDFIDIYVCVSILSNNQEKHSQIMTFIILYPSCLKY